MLTVIDKVNPRVSGTGSVVTQLTRLVITIFGVPKARGYIINKFKHECRMAQVFYFDNDITQVLS